MCCAVLEIYRYDEAADDWIVRNLYFCAENITEKLL